MISFDGCPDFKILADRDFVKKINRRRWIFGSGVLQLKLK